MGMKFITIAKKEISHWMSPQQREAKRKELRKEMIDGFLYNTFNKAKLTTKEDRLRAGPVFDALWDANSTDMGHYGEMDKIKVPLELLSREQILDMPKTSFTKKEWDSLSAADRRIIEVSPITSKMQFHNLVETITGAYSESEDDSEKFDTDEMLEDFIKHNASFVAAPPTGNRYQGVRSLANQTDEGRVALNYLYDYASSRNIDAGEVTEKTAYALEDSDNWSVEIEEDDYTEGFGIVPIPREIRLSRFDIQYLLDVPQDELDAAFEKANRDYPVNEGFEDTLTAEAISRMSTADDAGVSFEVEPSHVAIFTPDWETIIEKVREELDEITSEDENQFYSDDEPEPEEDRILYTWKDGSYVVRMIPEDLVPTGEQLSQCLRDPEYGYGYKIKNNTHALYSIKTKAGRPRITIEVELDSDGNPISVEQIYGKGNRFVGWGKGTPGEGKVKYMEVQQVGKVLELLGFDDFNDADIRKYLGMAHDTMREMDPEMPFTRNPPPLKAQENIRKAIRIIKSYSASNHGATFAEVKELAEESELMRGGYKMSSQSLTSVIKNHQEALEEELGEIEYFPSSYQKSGRGAFGGQKGRVVPGGTQGSYQAAAVSWSKAFRRRKKRR
jgi:hypothetical protein